MEKLRQPVRMGECVCKMTIICRELSREEEDAERFRQGAQTFVSLFPTNVCRDWQSLADVQLYWQHWHTLACCACRTGHLLLKLIEKVK